MQDKLLKIAREITGHEFDEFTCNIISQRIGKEAKVKYKEFYDFDGQSITSKNEDDLWNDTKNLKIRRQLMILLFREVLKYETK